MENTREELEITVESSLPVLADNFDDVTRELEEKLEQYDIVVTQDTVKDAKDLAAKLNKVAQHIDNRRKEEIAIVSEPIKQFDERMKTLVQRCKAGRQKIVDQVNVFEDEVRAEVEKLLRQYREELWGTLQVSDDYKAAEFDDLIVLGSITEKGNLTKGAKEKLEARVREDLAVQDKVKMRLLQLENASYKAGLSSPLTEHHVRHVLRAPDEVYNKELESLLAVEAEREKAAQAKMQERIDQEREQAGRERARNAESLAAAQEQLAEARKIMDEQPVPQDMGNAPEPPPEAVEQGQVAWEVTMKVWVSVPERISGEQINQAMRERLLKVGISEGSIASVQCRRV